MTSVTVCAWPGCDLYYLQISGNNTAFWRAAARQEIYMEFLKKLLGEGSGQFVTCSTSGIATFFVYQRFMRPFHHNPVLRLLVLFPTMCHKSINILNASQQNFYAFFFFLLRCATEHLNALNIAGDSSGESSSNSISRFAAALTSSNCSCVIVKVLVIIKSPFTFRCQSCRERLIRSFSSSHSNFNSINFSSFRQTRRSLQKYVPAL